MMLQVIPKWKITVYFTEQDALTFYLHDQHFANILKKFAEIDFDRRPLRVEIAAPSLAPDTQSAIQTATGTPYVSTGTGGITGTAGTPLSPNYRG